MTTQERDLLRAHSDRALTFSEPDGLGFVEMQAGPCPLYDWGCTVYDVRPFNCRRHMCGRETDEEPFEDAHVPIRFFRDRDFRRQMQVNERHHQKWARSHGWTAE